jgi:hypothetical protein
LRVTFIRSEIAASVYLFLVPAGREEVAAPLSFGGIGACAGLDLKL